MLTQIIDLSPVEPARIGFRMARGQRLNVGFQFQKHDGSTADMTGQNPQLMLRPRSKGNAYGYDLDMGSNPASGYGSLAIDGAAINDPHGYTLEMYSRDGTGSPTGLIALGEIAITGASYAYEGPFAPLTLPVVAGPIGETGPVGAQGEQGIRGGTWTTGPGDPMQPGIVPGDMWLDEVSGNVWRWTGTAWSKGQF